MEESVALDSHKQKAFVKSVRGIKKLIKKQKSTDTEEIKEDTIKPVKDERIKKRRPRGLVYLSHIPHGFYEHEMSQYFRQFGSVTNVRVIRSERTGNSKGYGFVEFQNPSVAQVVAETMNNYLMGKRLIKAVYIPPGKQRIFAKRKNWTPENNPTANRRRKQKKEINAFKTEEKNLQTARNMIRNLNKTKKKLKELGVDYDFFQPVDIPEGVEVSHDISIIKEDEKVNFKKEVSEKDINKKNVLIKSDKTQNIKSEGKNGNKKSKKVKPKVEVEDKETVGTILKKNIKKIKKDNAIAQNQSDETQSKKKQKLKDSNVKPLEDFIGIQEPDGESDGTLEFDSDEFEKAISGGDSLDTSDERNTSSEDDDKDLTDKSAMRKQQKLNKKGPQQQQPAPTNVKKTVKPIIAVKRKAEQKITPQKKVKFEKQKNKKSLNKLIKKK